ncbi:uncharacterized protein BO80DRAFT_483932, partial [Aspergillus ibericus CBS 121593]
MQLYHETPISGGAKTSSANSSRLVKPTNSGPCFESSEWDVLCRVVVKSATDRTIRTNGYFISRYSQARDSFIKILRVRLLQDETDGDLPRRPKKVSVGSGAIRFFKPTYCREQADREILALIHIRSRGLADVVRTPVLYELVKGPGDHTGTHISGILLEYIEHHSTLADIDMDATPWHIRKQWADQLQGMMRRLHAAGIVWGDAKPDNILVDMNNDLCI